jgi:N-acetylglutamate synthase-like GNAT family acetyltransferase
MVIDTVAIRRAVPADAEALAGLSADLGYDVSVEATNRRLKRVTANTDHEVLVAEDSSGTVAGWVHVFAAPRIESALFAELGGLVVAADQRRRGIGGLLIEAAEESARRLAAKKLRIRSRVEREPAHRFFERLGFETVKTQQVYEKLLQVKDI